MKISAYLLRACLIVVAQLPFWIIYMIADIIYFLMYYIVKYRKNIAFENIKNSFPQKTLKEREIIAKQSYRNLAYNIVEYVKLNSLSAREIMKRCKYTDLSVIEKYWNQKKSIIAVVGHFNNWEWPGISLLLQTKYQFYGVYKPITNKSVEYNVLKVRTKFGGQPVVMKQIYRHLLRNKDIPYVCYLASDQSPHISEVDYYIQFLNQDTPIYQGVEKLAKQLDLGVIFITPTRIGKGFFDIKITDLCSNPKETKDGEITALHAQQLEKEIIVNPGGWLWTHRRWKHKRF